MLELDATCNISDRINFLIQYYIFNIILKHYIEYNILDIFFKMIKNIFLI